MFRKNIIAKLAFELSLHQRYYDRTIAYDSDHVRHSHCDVLQFSTYERIEN